MINVRKSAERGHFNHGWLDTYHTFSFGDYLDAAQRGFRSLRVINEDRVQPGEGFGMHGHRDMEIITYVLSGALAHQDSMGNGETLRPGEFQHMTAGSGIRHSEFNPSQSEPVHLYQIWIRPEATDLPPSYSQQAFAPEASDGRLLLVASPDGADGSLAIRQNARLYLARLATGQSVEHALAAGRGAWLQVLRGSVSTAGQTLVAGDGAAFTDETSITVAGASPAEVLLFDLA